MRARDESRGIDILIVGPQHVIGNYISRVLKLEYDQARLSLKKFSVMQIVKTVTYPDVIYRDGDHNAPVYIRNGCAVPVKTKDSTQVVRTAYNSGVFLSKLVSEEEYESRTAA